MVGLHPKPPRICLLDRLTRQTGTVLPYLCEIEKLRFAGIAAWGNGYWIRRQSMRRHHRAVRLDLAVHRRRRVVLEPSGRIPVWRVRRFHLCRLS